MKLIFSESAWKDYLYWQRTDKKILNRTSMVINDIEGNKNGGIGKPEPLRESLPGYWSRRVINEHRIVYRIKKGNILIAQLRYHY